MKKSLLTGLIIIIILFIAAGATYAVKVIYFDKNIAVVDITCKTSGGEGIYSKGQVDFSQKAILSEGPIFEGHNLKVVSENGILLDGREMQVGVSQTFNVLDDVYYQKTDGSNGTVQVNVPTTILVKKIKYLGADNSENYVEVTQSTKNIDQCVGNILVENACIRGINTGYVCEKGCVDGACAK